MLHILPKVKSFGEEFGEQFGSGVGQGFSEGMDTRQENAVLKKRGIDLTGIRNPETRAQIIAEELKYGRQKKLADESRKIDYNPTGNKESSLKTGNEKLGINEKPGSNYQKSTNPVKEDILNVDQLLNETKRIMNEKAKLGIPASFEDTYAVVNDINNQKIISNQNIQNEIENKEIKLQQHGEISKQELLKVYPKPTGEIEALFEKKGQELAEKYDNPTDIKREAAREAKEFKNTIASIKRSVGPARLFTNIKESLVGNTRSSKKIAEDLNIKLEPLIKEGLYGTARNLLSELGYQPEERETILNKLGEIPNIQLSKLPEIKKVPKPVSLLNPLTSIPGYETPHTVSPEQKEIVKQNMQDIFTSDPSANLILLRKAYGDKNVDWETFKDNLDELILSGQVKLNPEQLEMLDVIEEPPLNDLERLLHKFNLIGK